MHFFSGDPFKLDFAVGSECWNSEVLLGEVKEVVLKYVSYSKRVNLLNRFHSNSTVTCLEKVILILVEYIAKERVGSLLNPCLTAYHTLEC